MIRDDLHHAFSRDGQGYTGVFIAVAIGSRVYEESGKKSIVDVFDCVNKMRSDRNQIVSSKELFAYIYKVCLSNKYFMKFFVFFYPLFYNIQFFSVVGLRGFN